MRISARLLYQDDFVFVLDFWKKTPFSKGFCKLKHLYEFAERKRTTQKSTNDDNFSLPLLDSRLPYTKTEARRLGQDNNQYNKKVVRKYGIVVAKIVHFQKWKRALIGIIFSMWKIFLFHLFPNFSPLFWCCIGVFIHSMLKLVNRTAIRNEQQRSFQVFLKKSRRIFLKNPFIYGYVKNSKLME